MTPERWQRVEELYAAARLLALAERAMFLEQACGSDSELREEVLSLLRQPASAGWLDTGACAWKAAAGLGVATTLVAGSAFGPYVISRLLGAGGMGEVYLAYDPRLERRVALKMLGGWLDPRPELIQRFTREARAVSTLTHPNIPVVYETGEVDGRPYIASEFIDGTPLSSRLGGVVLPWREAVGITLQVAQALRAAHEVGVVHRDVKPGNILVAADGQVKLVDFGIAKVAHSGRPSGPAGAAAAAAAAPAAPEAPEAPATTLGQVLGTPGYMAPEQAIGQSTDARSDVWSLAAVLHEMLTGRRPQGAPLQGGAGLPRALAGVVNRGLAPDPALRFPSAAALITALERARAQMRFPAQPLVLAGAGVALLATLVAAFLVGGRSPPQPRAPPALLVLRFDSLGSDPDAAMYSSGVQEELLAHLARISGLKVLAPHAAAGLPTHPVKLREVGRQLGVNALLEGSVQLAGARLRVVTSLIDTESGAQLWAESYLRDRSDIFQVEGDIAERVATRLEATLLAREQAAVETPDTRSPEAHAAYLRGRYFLGRPDQASLRKAVESFRQALQLDPHYALADSQLALAWRDLADYASGQDLLQAKAESRAAAMQAVQLDPDLSEAHVALGWVYLDWDWNLAGASQEFEAAAALAPNSARARNSLGTLQAILGRLEPAAALIDQARQLDPVSSGYVNNLAQVRLGQERWRDAETLFRAALELEPQAVVSHSRLSEIALLRGAQQEALREAQLEPDQGMRDFGLALAHQADRSRAEADRALQDFTRRYQAESPFFVAALYAFRNDPEHAFEWLDRAYAARDASTIEFAFSPLFYPLRQDPRYAAFRSRLGIPPPDAG